MEEVKRRQAERFRFLKHLYDCTNDFYEHKATSVAQLVGFAPSDLADELGIGHIQAWQITDYLCAQGLARKISKDLLVIQNAGVVEVEDALTRPDSSTEHFPE